MSKRCYAEVKCSFDYCTKWDRLDFLRFFCTLGLPRKIHTRWLHGTWKLQQQSKTQNRAAICAAVTFWRDSWPGINKFSLYIYKIHNIDLLVYLLIQMGLFHPEPLGVPKNNQRHRHHYRIISKISNHFWYLNSFIVWFYLFSCNYLIVPFQTECWIALMQ